MEIQNELPDRETLMLYVSEHIGTITTLLTPEAAGWMLGMNTGNRAISRGRNGVPYFVNAINRGEWTLTGEPIIVSREGILNDGQHRLTAIVEAGRAVPMDIRFGVAREAFKHTGLADRRTQGQVLELSGEVGGKRLAALIRQVYAYDHGLIFEPSLTLTSAQIIDLLEASPDYREVVAKTGHALFTRVAWFQAFVFMARRGTDHAVVDAFLFDLLSNEATPPFSAAMRFREIMSKNRTARTKERPAILLAVLIRAWNAWLSGKEMKRLAVHPSDQSQATYPEFKTGNGVHELTLL